MESKYDQRVRERAMEFAEAENNNANLTVDNMAFPEDFMHAARLSVQREAEAYIKANEAHYEGPVNMVRINAELQSLGLVPEKIIL